MYKKTNLKNYLYLNSLFFFLTLNMPVVIIRHRSEPSITLYILNITFLTLSYLSILLHFMSIGNDRISKPLLASSIFFIMFQFVARLFTTIQLIPSKSRLWGIAIFVQPDKAGLMAPALKIGEIYVVADGMPVFDHLFWGFVVFYGLITNIKIQPSINNHKSRKAKRFWILATLFWLIGPLGQIIGFFTNNRLLLSQVFQLLGGLFAIIFLGYIVWKYPYSLLLTKEQLVRARDLYKVVVVNEGKGRTLESLKNYLQELPLELIQLLES